MNETREELASPADETVLRALYTEMMDGWSRGSGAGFAAPFAEDCDFVAFDGTHFHGREAIAASHQQLFDTHMKSSRLVGHVTRIRFLDQRVALLHALGGTATGEIGSGARARFDSDARRRSTQRQMAVHRVAQHQSSADRTECRRHVRVAAIRSPVAVAGSKVRSCGHAADGACAVLGHRGGSRARRPVAAYACHSGRVVADAFRCRRSSSSMAARRSRCRAGSGSIPMPRVARDPDAPQLFNCATASASIAVDHRLWSDWFYSPTRCSSDPRRNSQRLRAPPGR